MAIHRVQIFGERCSGTNYLEALLSKNLRSIFITWDFGFKHFFPKHHIHEAPDCLFLIIYRDPFDWLRSIYTQPWHVSPELKRVQFSEFIRMEWWCIWNEDAGINRKHQLYGTEMMEERDPRTGYRFKNIMEMRNAKIQAWEDIRNQSENYFYINYESLREDPERILRNISCEFRISMQEGFQDIKRYKGVKWYQGWKTRLFRKQLPIISKQDRDYILTQLDTHQEKSIGYDVYPFSDKY